MTKSNATRRALLVSALATVMCLAMLIGTTFAWFTDTTSTGLNKIQAGNLDVELEYSKDFTEWKKVDSNTKVFDEDALWEPGYTQIVYLRVKNAGTLALKYTLGLGKIGGKAGRNVDGEQYFLRDYVKMGTVEATGAYTDREEAIEAVSVVADTIGAIGEKGVVGKTLMAGESMTYAMVVYMPTTVGNKANPKSDKDNYYASRITFGIAVNATQAPVESDSYGPEYDAKAPTVFTKFSTLQGTHEITENMQANGRTGAVEGLKDAQITINADVYAVYAKTNDGVGAAIAVWADGNSKIIINGGDFRQVGAPTDDDCDLIYASENAQIVINGGTFRAAQPDRTLNCDDDTPNAKITVTGGSFYKYDPSNPTLGDTEVIVPDGYHVEQNGDWYTVVED